MHNKSSLREKLAGTIDTAEKNIEDVLYEKWHIRLHKRAKHHIHQLRKRPDHHKDIISFFVAFVVTSIVFTGWYFISLPRIIESYTISKKESAFIESPLNSFSKVKETFSNIKSGNTGIQAE